MSSSASQRVVIYINEHLNCDSVLQAMLARDKGESQRTYASRFYLTCILSTEKMGSSPEGYLSACISGSGASPAALRRVARASLHGGSCGPVMGDTKVYLYKYAQRSVRLQPGVAPTKSGAKCDAASSVCGMP